MLYHKLYLEAQGVARIFTGGASLAPLWTAPADRWEKSTVWRTCGTMGF